MIDRDFIREYIAERAAGASEALPCHWIHGANEVDDLGCDEGADFCRECAEAKIAAYLEAHPDSDDEIGLDGGWGSDHDSQPRCDTCGVKLAGSLTNYGVDSELEHFETYRPYECEGWEALGDAVDCLADYDPADTSVSRKMLTRSQQSWAVVEAIITRDVHLSLLDILTARELDLQVPECEECGEADATRCPAESCGRPFCAGCNPLHYDSTGEPCEAAKDRS